MGWRWGTACRKDMEPVEAIMGWRRGNPLAPPPRCGADTHPWKQNLPVVLLTWAVMTFQWVDLYGSCWYPSWTCMTFVLTKQQSKFKVKWEVYNQWLHPILNLSTICQKIWSRDPKCLRIGGVGASSSVKYNFNFNFQKLHFISALCTFQFTKHKNKTMRGAHIVAFKQCENPAEQPDIPVLKTVLNLPPKHKHCQGWVKRSIAHARK